MKHSVARWCISFSAISIAGMALAQDHARVLSVTPIYLQTRVVCGEALPGNALPESSVAMRGFGGGRSGLSVCSEERGSVASGPSSSPEGGVAMRGFSGGGSATRRSTESAEMLAGYRVVIDYRGRQRVTALPNHPNEFVEVDPQTLQILALTDYERPYGRFPPRFEDCAAAYAQKDDGRAREVCGWLAERGDPGAQNKLANLWFDGRGGASDKREALRWDKLGAEQDHGRSMNNLGWMYEKGQGVPRDSTQAHYWYTRAAEQMDVCGLNSLATFFDKGIGQAADPALAAEYYRRSAQFGPSDASHCTALAQNSLGALYETGRGVPQSHSEAIRWYESAIRLGDKRAQRNLDRVLGQQGGRPQETFVTYPSVIYTLPSEAALQKQTAPTPVRTVVETTPPRGMGAELAAKLPTAPRKNSNGIAILIGNQKYDHRDINPVSFASNDVELMRHYVTKTLGYEQVKVLNGASKGDLESYFGNRENPDGLLAKWVNEMKPGEAEVFIYYSGHGAPGLQDRRGYLLPRDANPATVAISGYALDVLYENLGRLNTQKTTVVLESCFSGMSAGGTLVPRASALTIKPKLPAGLQNILMISASGPEQVASWDEKAHLGLMTRHFIEGVTGLADSNHDKEISSQELQEHLARKVAMAARTQYSREQRPEVIGSTAALVVLP